MRLLLKKRFIKKAYFFGIIFSAFGLIACDNDAKTSKVETIEDIEQENLEKRKDQLKKMSSSKGSVAASGKINPPHGQPGHRCDIPVGAPLEDDGDSDTPVQFFPSSNAGGSSGANKSTASSDSPELNPPHGEPGHRCEIPVGAPLNSEASTPQQPTIQLNPSSGEESKTSTSSDSPKINPPHGEPGHRCDVKVGDPLPS